jgi:hypothetical protein
LLGYRASGLDPKCFSDLFERLSWLVEDNGLSIRLALGVEEAFLFDSREAMVDAFFQVQVRWPETKGSM